MLDWLKRPKSKRPSAQECRPPVPSWRPSLRQPLDRIAERVRYYTDGKRDFALFQHGTCVLLPGGLSEPEAEQTAKNVLRDILRAHPDMKPLAMDDGNIVVEYNGPALNVVLAEVVEEFSSEIEQRYEEALAEHEVLFTDLGANRFDEFGKKALFGRCFMFMDAQAPAVVRIERKST